MLLEQNVKTRWVSRNRKWYEDKGYEFTKYNDILIVKAEDLTHNSDIRVEVKCDYCGEVKDKQFKEYNNSREKSPIKKDCCYKCRKLKNKESNLLIYGVDSTNKVPEILEKRFNTNLERYGAIAPSANDEVKLKVKNTMEQRYGGHYNASEEGKEKYKQYCLDNYGVENVFQLEEIKEKTKRTNLEKYGVEHHTQTKEYWEVYRNSMLSKYGADHPMHVDEIKEKARITMYENHSVPTSKNQLYLWNLYGGELNFPFKSSSIDIAFPEEKIGIEYDGGGHWLRVDLGKNKKEEFATKERNRNYGLYRGGWKIIRIISRKDNLPSNQVLIKMLSEAKEEFVNRSWIEYDIDNKTVRTHEYSKEYEYGKLKSYYTICKEFEEVN